MLHQVNIEKKDLFYLFSKSTKKPRILMRGLLIDFYISSTFGFISKIVIGAPQLAGDGNLRIVEVANEEQHGGPQAEE